jgi:hypothetical protein
MRLRPVLICSFILISSCNNQSGQPQDSGVSDLVSTTAVAYLDDCHDSASLFVRNPTEFLSDYQSNLFACEQSEEFLLRLLQDDLANDIDLSSSYSQVDDTYSAVAMFVGSIEYQIGELFTNCLDMVGQRLLCFDNLLSDNYAFPLDYDVALENANLILDLVPQWNIDE